MIPHADNRLIDVIVVTPTALPAAALRGLDIRRSTAHRLRTRVIARISMHGGAGSRQERRRRDLGLRRVKRKRTFSGNRSDGVVSHTLIAPLVPSVSAPTFTAWAAVHAPTPHLASPFRRVGCAQFRQRLPDDLMLHEPLDRGK